MEHSDMSQDHDINYFLTVLLELEKILSQDQKFSDNCQAFLQQLMGTFLVPKAALLLLDPERQTLYLHTGSGLGFDKLELRLDGEMLETILALDETVYLIDSPPLAIQKFLDDRQHALKSLESTVWVALRFKSHLVGILSLSEKYMNKGFSEQDQKLLKIISDFLAYAIHNQLLMTQIQALNIGEQSRAQETEIIRALSITGHHYENIEELTDEILRQCVKIHSSASGVIFLSQPHNPLLKIASAMGTRVGEDSNIHLTQNNKTVGRCFRRRECQIIRENDDRRLARLFDESQLIAAPLIINDEVEGIIILGGKLGELGPEEYTDGDIALVKAVSRQAGFTIENYLQYRNTQDREKALRQIYEQFPAGLMMLNSIGEVRDCNPILQTLLGMTEEEVLGVHFQTLFDSDRQIIDIIQHVQTNGTTHSEQFLESSSFPEHRWVNVAAAPVKNARGNVESVVVTVEGIPESSKLKQIFAPRVRSDAIFEIVYGERKIDLAGESNLATVLVARIDNREKLIGAAKPGEVFEVLNDYSGRIQRALLNQRATLCRTDVYEVVAVFGAPLSVPNHTVNAIEAAREMQEILTHTNSALNERALPPLELAIGLASGEVLMGEAKEQNGPGYQVLGKTLQAARHLCSIAFPGDVLVNPEARSRAGDAYVFEKGKRSKIREWSGNVQAWKLSKKE